MPDTTDVLKLPTSWYLAQHHCTSADDYWRRERAAAARRVKWRRLIRRAYGTPRLQRTCRAAVRCGHAELVHELLNLLGGKHV